VLTAICGNYRCKEGEEKEKRRGREGEEKGKRRGVEMRDIGGHRRGERSGEKRRCRCVLCTVLWWSKQQT
jgi:hypothetical protein